MTQITPTIDYWTEPTPYTVTFQTGTATYMRPGLMEQVVENRGMQLAGRIPVALNRAGDLGRYVWLEWTDGTIQAAIAVDCAQKQHFPTRSKQRRIVEVSAEIAQAHGFYNHGPVPVKVWFQPPPQLRSKRHGR